MTHPDPDVAEILDRNQQAIADAVHAPPPGIVDDPAAYLAWLRDTPPAPPPRTPEGRTAPPIRLPHLARRKTATPPQRPAQPAAYSACGCGTVLDPDGTCFACKETQ